MIIDAIYYSKGMIESFKNISFHTMNKVEEFIILVPRFIIIESSKVELISLSNNLFLPL